MKPWSRSVAAASAPVAVDLAPSRAASEYSYPSADATICGVVSRRSGSFRETPGVRNWVARALRVVEKDRELHARFTVRDRDESIRRAWERATEDLKAELDNFYAPINDALRKLRAGHRDAVEDVLDFLAADPWCFRSGYMKAKLMHALANGPTLTGEERRRAQRVVVHRLLSPQPGLQRHARRLGAAVWDVTLQSEVLDLVAQPEGTISREAKRLVAAVEQQFRTDGTMCAP